jgi:hypothetical protein
MKMRCSIRILLIVVIGMLLLAGCKPIGYYLTQLYKVHGKATVADTEPPSPIGSVEVVVGDYEYSELTNYYGDYELEMAEGTWTISFIKEGYEPYSAVVSVGPSDPRVRADAAMVRLEPPPTLTGHWLFSLASPDGEEGPYLLYFAQDGTIVTGTHGISGEMVNGDVTLYMEFDNLATFTGEFTGDEVAGTWSEDEANHYPWSMVRLDVPYGTLTIQGIDGEQSVNLNTDKALGLWSPVYTANVIRFETGHPRYGAFELRCWNEDFSAGFTYPVTDFLGDLDPEEAVCEVVQLGDGSQPPSVNYGTLSIDAYEARVGIAGSFTPEGGSSPAIIFDLAVGGTGTVSFDDYAGVSGSYGCTGIQQRAADYNEIGVIYRSEEAGFYLAVSNGQNLAAPGTYRTFNGDSETLSYGVHLTFGGDIDDGPFSGYPSARAGELILSRYDSTGMAGSFDVEIESTEGGTSGSVHGSFDVTFGVPWMES